jgi:hypothetical protein
VAVRTGCGGDDEGLTTTTAYSRLAVVGGELVWDFDLRRCAAAIS